ncbi:hypothetical protein BDV41DRAFT_577442 [Aspergillus transmontanensis]|uniref:Zn(2)-C6 fungal-type domain-containing protein n=1 Tax=Aspergillus transmontanensis TaxID=1034304 RepID=A0A5N6VX05_9EURO|nr:hypothetical protein BDV41DRAFT_577442 [Aspergillus transmontanensis]
MEQTKNEARISSKKTPCDSCRQRRVRCDGLLPCSSCQRTRLACSREYVRKRRGWKHGHGKKIEALRYAQSHGNQDHQNACEQGADILAPENLRLLMRRCVDIFLQQMYPIMPLFRPSTLVEWLSRPMEPNEQTMLFALCALVTSFLCGHSESILGCGEWESVARMFIRKSQAVRSEYNFVEDSSLLSLLASFFIAVTHFELHNARQSWFYLREAITLAQALGLHTDEFYRDMDYVSALYCRRTYNILFVTERSLAVARHKLVLLPRPLLLPTREPNDHLEDLEEPPEIDHGFRQLVHVYSQIDVNFLSFWSEKGTTGSTHSTWHPFCSKLLPGCDVMSDAQKADIFVTQRWLELVLWRAALQQGLLSSTAESQSRTFSYPEDISLSLLHTLSSLSQESVEVHGLGIFEKIYDVGNALADFIHCSINLEGWTGTMTENLDRLGSIQRYLSLSPNSHDKFALSLGGRLAEYSICFGSRLTMLYKFAVADEDEEGQRDACHPSIVDCFHRSNGP